MTKAEYMQMLKEKLESFGQELQEEIMEDYRQHFAEGEKQGRTEEEIIEELGNIEEMIRELDQDELIAGQCGKGPENLLKPEGYFASEACRTEPEPEAERSCNFWGPYKRIELSGVAADIFLETSEDEQIRVDYKNNGSREQQLAYTFYQYDRDGVFYAGVKRREMGARQQIRLFGKTILTYSHDSFMGSVNSSLMLKVKIPKGIPCIVVRTSSGDIHAFGLDTKELSCKTGSGDAELSRISAVNMELGTSSGDLSMNDADFETGHFSVASGDMEMKEIRGREIVCSTGSGDISLKARLTSFRGSAGSGDIKLYAEGNPEKIAVAVGSGDAGIKLQAPEGMEVAVSKGSGDVRISWNGERSRNVKGGTYTYGNGACRIKAATGSGDIDIYGI